SEQRGQRKNPAAESFPNDQHVGHDIVVFASEHSSSAAKAGRNFVKNQERAVPVARGSNFFPVFRRRNEWSTAHCLGNDGGDIPFFIEHVLDVLGATQVARGSAFEWTVPIIGWRHVLAARQKRTRALAKNCLATNRDRVQRGAVKGVPH